MLKLVYGFSEIIQLSPNEWQEYKSLRLRALKNAPQAFGASYAGTVSKPDEYWRDRLEQHGKGQSWSLFAQVDKDLVGMLEAAVHASDPDKVWLHAMYVDEAYRGLGVAIKINGNYPGGTFVKSGSSNS